MASEKIRAEPSPELSHLVYFYNSAKDLHGQQHLEDRIYSHTRLYLIIHTQMSQTIGWQKPLQILET